jgi:hypothetical protein
MRLTIVIIIHHVLHALELGFRNQCVSLVPSILIRGSRDEGEDVGVAVLEEIEKILDIGAI